LNFGVRLLLKGAVTRTYSGCDPFNKNFRAEVQKFLGVEWIATGPDGLIPFHSQNKFRAHLNGGYWITVAHTRATVHDNFDGDINYIFMSCLKRSIILSIPFPDICHISSNTTFE